MKYFCRKKELKDGTAWYPTINHQGKQYSFGGWPTKRQAEARGKAILDVVAENAVTPEEEARVLEQLAAGTYGQDRIITFDKYTELWLAEAKGRVKPRVHNDYTAIVKNHLSPAFGKMTLDRIMPPDIKKFIIEKQKAPKPTPEDKKESKPLAPATVNKILVILKAILHSAVHDKYINSSPAENIKKLRDPKHEMDFLTDKEVTKLLEAVKPRYYPILATAVYSGLRQGELLALKWKHVDLDKEVIHVRESYDPKYGVTDPKSQAGRRTVHISRYLAKVLEANKNVAGPDDIVFPNKFGGYIHPRNLLKYGFEPALTDAKIRHIRFHDLRHTYGAIMAMSNEPIKFVQRQMGHQSIKTTFDRYGHLYPDAPKGFGKRFDAFLNSPDILPFKVDPEKTGGTGVEWESDSGNSEN